MFSVFACLCPKKNISRFDSFSYIMYIQEFSLFFPLNFQLPVSINAANPRSRPSISPNIHRPTPIRNHQAEFLLRIPLPGWIKQDEAGGVSQNRSCIADVCWGYAAKCTKHRHRTSSVFCCKGDPGISPSHRPSMQGSSPSPWIQHGPCLKVKHIW